MVVVSLQEQFSSERTWRNGPGISDGSDIEAYVLGRPAIPPDERINNYLSFAAASRVREKIPTTTFGAFPNCESAV